MLRKIHFTCSLVGVKLRKFHVTCMAKGRLLHVNVVHFRFRWRHGRDNAHVTNHSTINFWAITSGFSTSLWCKIKKRCKIMAICLLQTLKVIFISNIYQKEDNRTMNIYLIIIFKKEYSICTQALDRYGQSMPLSVTRWEKNTKTLPRRISVSKSIFISN